ncbi:hypothetical protein Tco_1414886, partial [Tanacetum coccineum]
MFILYCIRAIAKDLRLAREINGLCDGLTAVIKERELFIGELETLVDRFVPEKMGEFLKETQAKDTDKLMKYQLLYCSVFFPFLVDDDNSKRSKCFAKEDFGSAVVPALVCALLPALCLTAWQEWTVNSSDWDVMFIHHYRREISEDLWLSREINALCAQLTAIVDERERFVNELDRLVG